MTPRRSLPLGGAIVALLLGGCSGYLDRSDTMTRASGNAVATNLATHVIDPWPRQSARVDRTTNGERAARAIERYRNPQTGSGGLGLPIGIAPAAGAAGVNAGVPTATR